MSPFVCIDSGEPLEVSDERRFGTRASRGRYPIVDDIPVLIEDPDALVLATQRAWTNMKALAEQEMHELDRLRGAGARDGLLQRAARQASGNTANVKVLEKYMAALGSYTSDSPRASSCAVTLPSAEASWGSLHPVLGYFAQDWTDSPDFRRVRDAVVDDWVRYGPDRKSVAVLGAGGCGLVRALAEVSDVTYGIDLSLPALLVAQALFRGDAITLHIPGTGWAPVSLESPPPSPHPIHLAVADANRLPLADATLSAVVTQYFMDLMVDPMATAREIQRVLKPGGLWINFSKPLQLFHENTTFGKPDVTEMQSIFAPLRFEEVHCRRERFTFANLDHVRPEGDRKLDDIHHFVLRKSTATNLTPARASSPDFWWTQIARKTPHRALETCRRTIFNGASVARRFEVRSPLYSASVDERTAAFFEALMEQIDGTKSLAEIHAAVNARIALPRDEFRGVLDELQRTLGVLTFRSPQDARSP